MNVDLSVFMQREANPASRVLAFVRLSNQARHDITQFSDEDVISLGQFVWSQGNTDTWLAISGTVVLGTLAHGGDSTAIQWLRNLSQRAHGSVRHTAMEFLNSLGV